MKITTEYDMKPIPLREWDWSAIDSDTYDADCDQDGFFSNSPVGYGATEQEAIDDLKEQLAEEDEAAHTPTPEDEWMDDMAFNRQHAWGKL